MSLDPHMAALAARTAAAWRAEQEFPPDVAHRFVASTEPGYEHTCAVSGCNGLEHDEEHTGGEGILPPPAEVVADGLGLRGYACAPCTRLGFARDCLAGRCGGGR